MRAIKTELSYQGHLLPMYRAYQFQQDVTIITIRTLPTFSKEDTYAELERTFQEFGDISDVQFLYYPGTSIRMDSCIVHLERPPLPSGQARTSIPRIISIFGAKCDLHWKNAGPFCRYCRQEGHWKQDCPKLMAKSHPALDNHRPPRREPAQQKPPQQEPPQPEPPRREPPRLGPPRQEPPRREPPRAPKPTKSPQLLPTPFPFPPPRPARIPLADITATLTASEMEI